MKAFKFFEKGAHHGNPGALNNLALLYDYGGTYVQRDANKARSYYKASCLKGMRTG